MKYIFTLLLLGSISIVNAQLIRAFNDAPSSTISNALLREDAVQFNEDLCYATISRSTDDTLRIISNLIDTTGKTSNYRSFETIITDFTMWKLNGMWTNGEEVIVVAQARNQAIASATNGQHVFYKFNQLTGAFIDQVILPDVVKISSANTILSQDSLVMYQVNDNGDLIRMAVDPITLNHSTTVALTGPFNTGSVNSIGVETLQLPTGEEIISFSNKLVKRTISGTYTTSTAIYTTPPGRCTLIGTDKISLFNFNKCIQFDFNLDSLTTVSLGFNILDLPTRGCFTDGNYLLYHNEITVLGNINKSIYDEDINIIDQQVLGSSFINSTVVPYNGKYIRTGKLLKSERYLSAIIECTIANEKQFIELGEIHDFNALRFNTGHNGQFFNTENSVPGLQYMHNGAYNGLIYSSSSSVIGKNSLDELVGDAQHYFTDLITAPVTNSIDLTQEVIDSYNRGFYVTREMIDQHLTNITTGNPSYVIPFGIQFWPVHGDVSIGQAEKLLNFVDINENGLYEPELGDYPKIYGDECVAKIYHSPLDGGSGLEYHEFIYTFNCDTSEVMKNTIFYNLRVFSRDEDLTDVYLTSFNDYDIGYYSDDYFETNVNLGLVYSFNGDALDETSGGNNGFGEFPPASGQLFLRGGKIADDGNDNDLGIMAGQSPNGFGFSDGVVDNEYYTLESSRVIFASSVYPYSDPMTMNEWYDIAQGKNVDGSYPGYSGYPVHYMYFGASDPMNYASFGIDLPDDNYTEPYFGNIPSDRRFYAGTGPTTLSTSTVDTFEFVSAFITAYDGADNTFDEQAAIVSMSAQLKQMYADNDAGCGNSFYEYVSPTSVGIDEVGSLDYKLYPNPTQGSIFIAVENNAIDAIEIYSLSGERVLQITSGKSMEEINLASLTAGVYIIHIQTPQGVIQEKIIKQ